MSSPPPARSESVAINFLMFILFAMKRCLIAANIAGSIGVLSCCILNDFFRQGHERLPDL